MKGGGGNLLIGEKGYFSTNAKKSKIVCGRVWHQFHLLCLIFGKIQYNIKYFSNLANEKGIVYAEILDQGKKTKLPVSSYFHIYG